MSQGRRVDEDVTGSGAGGADGPGGCVRSPQGVHGSAGIFGAVLRSGESLMHGLGPHPLRLRVRDWHGHADETDRALLAHCEGPTLDVGCGPGRMAAELASRGRHAMGIDVAPDAVTMARSRGVVALLADVFAPLPAEGLWQSVLLADGNIGIGGDPRRLLRRVRDVLAPGGRAVAELASPGSPTGTHHVTVETDGVHSPPFRWAVVAPTAIAGLAAAVGFATCELHRAGDRFFAVLHEGA